MGAVLESVLLSYFYRKHSNRFLLFLKFVWVNLWTAWEQEFSQYLAARDLQKPLFSSRATWFFTWKLLENRLFCLIYGAGDFPGFFHI